MDARRVSLRATSCYSPRSIASPAWSIARHEHYTAHCRERDGTRKWLCCFWLWRKVRNPKSESRTPKEIRIPNFECAAVKISTLLDLPFCNRTDASVRN